MAPKTSSATLRLKQDYVRLKNDPVPYVVAEPNPSNILEWYAVFRATVHGLLDRAKAVNLADGVHESSIVFSDIVDSTRTRFMNILLGPPHPFLTYFLLSLNFSLQCMLRILAVRYSCVHNVSYVHITRNVLLCVANNINNNY